MQTWQPVQLTGLESFFKLERNPVYRATLREDKSGWYALRGVDPKIKDLNGELVEQWFSFSGVVLCFPSREVAYIEGEAAGLLMNKGIT